MFIPADFTLQHPSQNDCFADDAVEDAEENDAPLSSVSIKGRPLCNLRFAEHNSHKSKILVNSMKPRPSTNVRMNVKTLEEVYQFKYLGSTQTKDGISIKEVKIRLVQAHSALTRLVIL